MNFIFEQEHESSKKRPKQECIEYILSLDYGETIKDETLAKILHYNLAYEEEYKKYRAMMALVRKFLIEKGRVLRSIPHVGYYILKPSQISQHCYRTYILHAGRLYDKSARVLDRTDKTGLKDERKEEIENMINLNKELIDKTWKTIQESVYYSRKDVYDSLKED